MEMKFLRQQLGKSQEDVAKELNMPRTKYARYETGESNPTVDTLIVLANYYGVSLDYLCGRQFNNQVGYIPDDRKELVRLLLNLDDEDVSKLFGYASALLENKKNK